jgi:hypothetical protein
LFWNEPRENQVCGLEILQEAERQVQVVRENLQLARSSQKSYADHRRRKLSFEISDFVYLKVSPMRGLCCFKIRGKLAPRYVGSFKILEQRGEVAYQLELPSQLSDVHDVFSCFTTKEVFASSGRIGAFGRINNWRRSYVSRIPGENFGQFRENQQE